MINNPLELLRILEIQGILEIKDISEVFEHRMNRSEIELLIGFFDRKYDLSNGDNDPYNFIKNVIGISEQSLDIVNADQIKYMDTSDTLECIIYNLIDRTNNMDNKNGFPFKFNLEKSFSENLIQDYRDYKYLPCNNLSNDILKTILTNYPEIKEENLFFHGTDWSGADSILTEIRITQKQFPSDFGLRNFYLSDNFKYAIEISQKYTQRAVVIFHIPREFLEGLNKLHLSDIFIDDWKELIFNVRNNPNEIYKNNTTIRKYQIRQINKEHNKYISDLDSLDLVSGPICRNPKATNKEDLEYLSHDGIIPYQYSFKDSSYSFLNDFILLPIYFRSSF